MMSMSLTAAAAWLLAGAETYNHTAIRRLFTLNETNFDKQEPFRYKVYHSPDPAGHRAPEGMGIAPGVFEHYRSRSPARFKRNFLVDLFSEEASIEPAYTAETQKPMKPLEEEEYECTWDIGVVSYMTPNFTFVRTGSDPNDTSFCHQLTQKCRNKRPQSDFAIGPLNRMPRFQDWYNDLAAAYLHALTPGLPRLTIPGPEDLLAGSSYFRMASNRGTTSLSDCAIRQTLWFGAVLEVPGLEEHIWLQSVPCLNEHGETIRLHFEPLHDPTYLDDRLPTDFERSMYVDSINDTQKMIQGDIELAQTDYPDQVLSIKLIPIVMGGPLHSSESPEDEIAAGTWFGQLLEMLQNNFEVPLILVGGTFKALEWQLGNTTIFHRPFDAARGYHRQPRYRLRTNIGQRHQWEILEDDEFATPFWNPQFDWTFSGDENFVPVSSMPQKDEMAEEYLFYDNYSMNSWMPAAEEIILPEEALEWTLYKASLADECIFCKKYAESLLWAGNNLGLADCTGNCDDTLAQLAMVSPEEIQMELKDRTRLSLYNSLPAWEFVSSVKATGADIIAALNAQKNQFDRKEIRLAVAGLVGDTWEKAGSCSVKDFVFDDGTPLDEDAIYTVVTSTRVSTRQYARWPTLGNPEGKYVSWYRPHEAMEMYCKSSGYAASAIKEIATDGETVGAS